ncbi:MAG: hypothetical protein ACE5DZ_01980 [Mariprofundus sp.]
MQKIALRPSISCIKGSVAFFICPYGETLTVRDNHISSVISNPERFGFDFHELEARHKTCSEPLYKEGIARTEILLDLVHNDWIRLRRYPNRYWSATVKTLSPCTMKHLRIWARKIVNGINSAYEEDIFMPVRITPIAGGKIKCITLATLLDRDKPSDYIVNELNQ